MSTATLEGCWAKLNRAEEQLNLLGEELTDYVESRPYSVSSEPDQRGALKVFTYQNVRHPPARFGVIAGEAVHDMRSCLDHLVWQLVLRAGNRPDARNQFPICFLKKATKPKEKRAAWNREWPDRLKGVASPHIALIESAQPYKRRRGPKGHELSLLTSLWNTDKHRIVHTAALSTPKRARANISLDLGGFDRVALEFIFQPGRLKNKAPAFGLRIVSAPYGSPRHVDVKGEFPIQVTFGARNIGMRRLRGIGDFICKFIFDNLRKDFPKATNEPPRDLFPTRPDPNFPDIDPTQVQAKFVPTQDTKKRFDGWKVWFTSGQFVPLPGGGGLPIIQPTWHLLRDGESQELVCSAVGLEPAQLRLWLLEHLEPGTAEQVLRYFAPTLRIIEGREVFAPT